MPFEVEMCFDPGWTVRRKQGAVGSRREWLQNSMPLPFIKFRPSSVGHVTFEHEKARIRPCIYSGEIQVYGSAHNKSHTSFAQRFYRLFGKFATNRNQRGSSYWKAALGHSTAMKKGSTMWLGHHAIRWVREDPERLLYDSSNMTGFEPLDDVADEESRA